MSDFISIDGKIKEKFLPFIALPGSAYSKFSFKEMTNGNTMGLGVFPTTAQQAFNADIGNKLIYKRDDATAKIVPEGVKFSSILESMPSIQIREYLPDNSFDQLIQMFSSLFGIATKEKEVKGPDGKPVKPAESDESFFAKVKSVTTYVVKYLTGSTNPSFWTEASGFKKFDSNFFANYGPMSGQDDNEKTYVLRFPYLVYHKILSSTTTNQYVLPCIVPDQVMYESSGAGWEGNDWRLGEVGVLKAANNIPLVGDFIRSLTNSIAISYQRPWDASKQAQMHPEIKMVVNLFNDTLQHALANFVFVNTLVPNNMFIQYNIFQHAPCVYDIKIEGFKRLYMCAAKFNVKSKGVLRDPSEEFIKQLKTHVNTCMNADAFIENIKKNKLVKIPDVYQVELVFSSVINENFNTFLYNYASNNNIETDIANNGLYEKGKLMEIVNETFGKFKDNVKAVWQGGGFKEVKFADGTSETLVPTAESMKSVLDKLKTSVEQYRKQLDDIQDQISEAYGMADEGWDKIQALEDQRDALNDQIDQAESEIDSISKKLGK